VKLISHLHQLSRSVMCGAITPLSISFGALCLINHRNIFAFTVTYCIYPQYGCSWLVLNDACPSTKLDHAIFQKIMIFLMTVAEK